MELHHLRIFVIVAAEQNLTKGAQRLYMTPPTVSAHIKALEQELGVELFIRTSKGMELTEKGKLLKAKAERTLQAAQDFVNYATDLHSRLIGRLRCGLNATPGFLRVGAVVRHMQQDCPGIDLELVACSSGSILDGLQQGTMDAGYVFGVPPNPSITAHSLGRAEVVIAVPRQWSDRLTGAEWADLAQLPWISSDRYCPFEAYTADLFQQRGLQHQCVVQSQDEATKAELIAAGVGAAMLERSEAEQAQQAHRLVIWETAPMYSELYLAYSNTRQDDPLIRALRKAMQEVWKPARQRALTP